PALPPLVPSTQRPPAPAVAPSATWSPSPPSGGVVGKLLPIAADVVVCLLLLAVGAFLGEFLAGKPTREVWIDAGSSGRFPPMDLLMWLAMPVVLGLIYGLLISRGQSVGGWLKRRQAI